MSSFYRAARIGGRWLVVDPDGKDWFEYSFDLSEREALECAQVANRGRAAIRDYYKRRSQLA